jgi:peptidase E
MTRKIFLLGGGFSDDPDTLIDEFVLAATPNPRPRICFIPTASGDSRGYVERFYAAFEDRQCEPSDLQLFRREQRDLRPSVLAQDILYVGGGNTANLLAVWRLHGLDQIVREAYEAGVVLCGISAGAACWLESCLTDSFGSLAPLRDGLGLLPGSMCPHYDSEGERRPAYRAAIAAGALPPGWAVDDGAAALFTDERLTEVVARVPGVTVHHVTQSGGAAREESLPARLLTATRDPLVG